MERQISEDTTERTFIAIGYNCWGRGTTVNEAIAALRRAGHKLGHKGILVKMLPKGARDISVDRYGTIHWTGEGSIEVVYDTTTKQFGPRGKRS